MKENIIKYAKVLGVTLAVLFVGNLIYALLSILAYKVLGENTTSIILNDNEVFLGKTVLQIISNTFYSLTVLAAIILGVALARRFKAKFLRFLIILFLSSVFLNLYITILNLGNSDLVNFLVNGTQEVTFHDTAFNNIWFLLFNSLVDGITTMLPIMSIGYLLGRALDNHKDSRLFKLLRIRD
jgi:hypothetical protein